jgi:ppGpp synthetase/RelA/SpoT-type nucleotidyltranferase
LSLDAAALLAEYRAVYETYKTLGARVAAVIEDAAKATGVASMVVHHRPKDPAHYVIKALKKQREKPEEYADPLAATPDKAGVRVVVALLDDVALVREAAELRLEVHDVDDKTASLEPDRLGYLGLHLQVSLKDADLGADRHLAGLECEIQVHTKAQNAWADVSHPLLYKPTGEPSRRVQQRIMRAVALVSLFDDEVQAARREVEADPMYQPSTMLDTLAGPIPTRTYRLKYSPC